tara:strand:- start:144 stop:998 length:855 start_codon:yes stop_codon:yes gene_type:complete
MINKLSKTIIAIIIVFLAIDISFAFKMPGGMGGGKKSKKSSSKMAAVAKLEELKYNDELKEYFDIGTFNMAVAGNRMCQKIQLAQIKLALVKKSTMSATEDIVNIGANREAKLQLKKLQEEIDALGSDKYEERRAKMDEKWAILDSEIEALNADETVIKEEQKKIYLEAMAKSAANWVLLTAAAKDFADIAKEVKESIDATKDALEGAKDAGFSGMKDVPKITANLKAIPSAVEVGAEIVKGVGAQLKMYGKFAKALKANKYKAPTMEEASADVKPFDASDMMN